ncbi:MAG: mechanosensitive ion channel [Chthoniobacterales bacterium]|nr:mechanosensitive ion channel [Chthoniobacterales bacterium]
MSKVWTPDLSWGLSAFIVLLACGWGAAWVLRRFCRSRSGHPQGGLRWKVLDSLVPIVRWGFFITGVAAGVHLLDLPPAADRWADRLLQASFVLLVAFVASAAVRLVLGQWALRAKDPGEERTRRTLAPVLSRSCQVFLVTVAALLALQNAGYNVAGLLAGLGIGGLAVALAAKETLANLFGSLAVLLDRTFQVGDNIRTSDITGTVVRIGLRSTRVRTAEGYIVSIPNQIITNAPVTNMGPHAPSA